jgi:NTP pyrophosphatase (non-canonical NTP hydrolase)
MQRLWLTKKAGLLANHTYKIDVTAAHGVCQKHRKLTIITRLRRRIQMLNHKIRPQVAIFAEAMEHKLVANDHKGGWVSYAKEKGIAWFFARMLEEADELRIAIDDGADANTILLEAADVANFAMMIADIAAQADMEWASQITACPGCGLGLYEETR